ncbi:MAG TPA: O-antigen ligase family protein [Gemmatimonadales bacterium]|nr:O-antigen ligase family protein [Gemmatimonadales bacterium]
MALTAVLLVAASLLSQALTAGPVAVVLLAWVSVLAVGVASGEGVPVVPALWRFLAAFGALAIAEWPFWGGSYRISNLLGTVAFLFLIPSIVVALSLSRPGVLRAMSQGVMAAFWLFSACVLVYGLGAGIDLQRDMIFVPDMQKNGVGAIYELLFLYTFGAARGNVRTQLAALLVACPALLVIGSKTALALGLLFAIGMWARWLFLVGAPAALVSVIWEALKFDYESSLRTAAFRLLTWQQAWQEINASARAFWLGNGPAAFIGRLPQFDQPGTPGTHNIILQFWHGYGLVGLLLLAGFFFWVWRKFGFVGVPGIACFWLFNVHALFDVGWVNGPGFVASLVFGLGIAAQVEVSPAMLKVRAAVGPPPLALGGRPS